MRRVWRRTSVLVASAALVALALAPAAPGASRFQVLPTAEPGLVPAFEPPPLAAGPQLMGDSVAWAGLTVRGYAVHVTRRDGHDHVAGVVGAPVTADTPPYRSYSANLEASGRRLALSLTSLPCRYSVPEGCDYTGSISLVLTAARNGELERLIGCRDDACRGCLNGDAVPVDVAGGDVLYGDPCEYRGAFLRRYADGAAGPARALPKGSERLTDRYLGVDEGADMALYDRSTGERVLTSDGDRLFDVQRDGKVAFGVIASEECNIGTCYPAQIGWSSPASPAPHRFGDYLEEGTRVRMARNRIAYRELRGDLHLVDLQGTELAAASMAAAVGDFDFDGRRLAFAVRPCESVGLVVWDLTGPVPGFPSGSCPAPAIASTAARRHGGVVPVRVACPAIGDLGCAGTMRLVADASPGGGGSEDTFLLGQRHYTVAPGASRTLAFEVSDAGRGFLEAHRGVRIRVDALARTRPDTDQPGIHSAGSFRLLD